LLKAIIVLLPLLGLTWIIGIVAVNENTQVFAWMFAILNSLQVCKQIANNLNYVFNKLFLGCLHICESCIEKQTGDNHLNKDNS